MTSSMFTRAKPARSQMLETALGALRPAPAPSKDPATPVRQSRAFSPLELLVDIAIIGIPIALLSPTVKTAPDEARQRKCTNNLKQIGLALPAHNEP